MSDVAAPVTNLITVTIKRAQPPYRPDKEHREAKRGADEEADGARRAA